MRMVMGGRLWKSGLAGWLRCERDGEKVLKWASGIGGLHLTGTGSEAGCLILAI